MIVSEKTCHLTSRSRSTAPWCSGTFGRGSESMISTTRSLSQGTNLTIRPLHSQYPTSSGLARVMR